MDKSRSSSRSHFFGFKEVSEEQKRENINNVFSSVASEYDIMNDIMSLGVHRLWKRSMIKSIKSFTGKTLLDVAAGTGDISLQFVQNGGKKAIVSDINDNMLENAKHRSVCYNQEVKKRLEYMIANAESLPFEDNMFDYYTISFGIRNVTDIKTALREANRVLKPFGKFVCMEFNSHIDNKIVRKLYDLYSFNIIPKIGEIVTGDRDAYRYLSESIRVFPKKKEFVEMIEESGFTKVKCRSLTCGIVNIYTGFKTLDP